MDIPGGNKALEAGTEHGGDDFEESEALIFPSAPEVYFNGDQFREGVSGALSFQKMATQTATEVLSSSLAQDPSVVLDFYKVATDGAVKMVDAARKVTDSYAKSAAYFAAKNSRDVPRPAPRPVNPSEQTVEDAPDGPSREASPSKVAPATAPRPAPEPVVEAADLSTSRFGDLGSQDF
jgi:hypothetical protein